MENRKMDMRTYENELLIAATNLPEFKELLVRAEKEAEQLRSTIAQLSRFELSIRFEVAQGQAGDMEAASSVMSTIPTK